MPGAFPLSAQGAFHLPAASGRGVIQLRLQPSQRSIGLVPRARNLFAARAGTGAKSPSMQQLLGAERAHGVSGHEAVAAVRDDGQRTAEMACREQIETLSRLSGWRG